MAFRLLVVLLSVQLHSASALAPHEHRAAAFLRWFDARGGARPGVDVAYYGDVLGFGVRATTALSDGDVLVRVPLASVVCARTLRAAAADDARMRTVWDSISDDQDMLAVWLMRERARSVPREGRAEPDAASWWPYLDMLPRAVNVPSTWPADELSALQSEAAAADALEYRQGGRASSPRSRDSSLAGRYNRLVMAIREALRDVDLAAANAAYAAHELSLPGGEREARALGFGGGGARSAAQATPLLDAADEDALAAVDLVFGTISGAPPSAQHVAASAEAVTASPAATPDGIPAAANLIVEVDAASASTSASEEPAAGVASGLLSSLLHAAVPAALPTAASPVPGSAPAGLPGFGDSHDSLQSFVWAATLIDSRALTIRGKKYLVPLSDMLNYEAAPGAALRVKADGAAFLLYHRLELQGTTDDRAAGTAEAARWAGGSFAVSVDRDLAAGAQVVEDYGDSDSAIYLQHHGMVPLDVGALGAGFADSLLEPPPSPEAEAEAAAAEAAVLGGLPDPHGDGLALAAALATRGAPDVASGNPFDCVRLPMPPLRPAAAPATALFAPKATGAGGGDELAQQRRRLAEALGLSPRLVNATCVTPPREPAFGAGTDAVTVATLAAHAQLQAADPVPEPLHRWLAVAALSLDDLARPPCEAVVSHAARQHALLQQAGGTQPQGQPQGQLRAKPPPPDLVRACLDLPGPGAPPPTAGAPPPPHYVRVARLLTRALAAFPTRLGDDSGALRSIAAHGSATAALAALRFNASALSGVAGLGTGAVRVLRELAPLPLARAWLALAFRATRKQMLGLLLRFYARLGPWALPGEAEARAARRARRLGPGPVDETEPDEQRRQRMLFADAAPPLPLSASAASNVALRPRVPDHKLAAATALTAAAEVEMREAARERERDAAAALAAASAASMASASAPAAPLAAARPAPSSDSPPAPSAALVQIGLASLPARDAACYFTEAEHALALRHCEVFHSWFMKSVPAVALVRAVPVGGGMRLGAVTVAAIAAEQVYLTVPVELIMDSESALGCGRLGPVLQRLRRRQAAAAQLDDFATLLLHLLTEMVVKHGRSVVPASATAAGAGAGGDDEAGADGALGGGEGDEAGAGNSPFSAPPPASKFAPYLDLLPDTDHMPFPLFFSARELAALEGSPMLPSVQRYSAEMDERFTALRRTVLALDASAFPPRLFSRAAFRWAAAVLDSRAIWWGRKRHLVPLLDLINSAEGPRPARVHHTRLSPAGDLAVTRADRDYPASEVGAQMWENYGQPNWVYFQFHGFSLLGNSHDCVRVDLVAPADMRAALARGVGDPHERAAAAAAAGAGAVAPSAEAASDAAAAGASQAAALEAAAASAAARALGGGRDYWEALPELAALSPREAALLRSRRGRGLRESAEERRRQLAEMVDPAWLGKEACVRVAASAAFPPLVVARAAPGEGPAAPGAPGGAAEAAPVALGAAALEAPVAVLDASSEEALLFLTLAWETDRLGALLLLRALAAAQLRQYPTRLRGDVAALLRDLAAQLVLGLAPEEDAAAQAEQLLDYAFAGGREDEDEAARAAGATGPEGAPDGSAPTDAGARPLSFDSFRGEVLAMVRDAAGGYARARAALLAPRLRAAAAFLVTEKAQLRRLAGLDARGAGAGYGLGDGAAMCQGPELAYMAQQAALALDDAQAQLAQLAQLATRAGPGGGADGPGANARRLEQRKAERAAAQARDTLRSFARALRDGKARRCDDSLRDAQAALDAEEAEHAAGARAVEAAAEAAS